MSPLPAPLASRRSRFGAITGALATGALAALSTTLVVACSGTVDDPSPFPSATPGATTGPAAPGTNQGGSGPFGGPGGGGGSSGGAGNVTPECASVKAKADRLPLEMIVVLDKSGSMCEYTTATEPRNCGNAASKWKIVTKALETFFRSFESAEITVSLIAFPNGDECNAATYRTPIERQKLPLGADALVAKMNGLSPNGSTPTTPAADGAVQYAKTVDAALAGRGKTVIVFATDGLPQGCNNNSIQAAGNVVGVVSSTIKSYVIGVGANLTALNDLAVKGGTSKALLVSNANTTQASMDLTTALSQIRGASLACEYALPAPPAGQKLDINAVNVQFTLAGGTPQTLPYSADCSNAKGWRYDSATAPTKITLCQTACDDVKATAGTESKLDVVLGCKTEGGTPR
ncbi:MAG: VWA domain-containing protein [Myxococcales bacterium]|nr:VWA domain-containing protein [Myxococcales bacterium]MBL0195206.1 VWA domain-containing protein [Myxococcales bacterium]HQY61883.1 vWA domain-containing protein [Polyangiaceae bacterium]